MFVPIGETEAVRNEEDSHWLDDGGFDEPVSAPQTDAQFSELLSPFATRSALAEKNELAWSAIAERREGDYI